MSQPTAVTAGELFPTELLVISELYWLGFEMHWQLSLQRCVHLASDTVVVSVAVDLIVIAFSTLCELIASPAVAADILYASVLEGDKALVCVYT